MGCSQEITKSVSGNNDTLVSLVKMGFKEEEALIAIERLGAFLDYSVLDL